MSSPRTVLSVVGTRPNFVKIAPILEAMRAREATPPPLRSVLVHTGQHYDRRVSDLFFEELAIPEPAYHLGIGGGGGSGGGAGGGGASGGGSGAGSAAAQTGEVLLRLEPVIAAERPDLVLVTGDVTSTLAAALTAAKMGVPVAHVEAGLRSRDRTMPEELNRILTDQASELLLASEPAGVENLRAEGVAEARIHLVGNVMIDTLHRFRSVAAARSQVLAELGLLPRGYAVVTIHRPSNVDRVDDLERVVEWLRELARLVAAVVFPVHPRTRRRLEDAKLLSRLEVVPGLRLVDPLGYLDFLRLTDEAALVVTDSGGIQEETTVLGVPCVTVRDSTERPVTIAHGTNVLAGREPAAVAARAAEQLARYAATGGRGRCSAPLWDGRAAERIVAVLESAPLGRAWSWS